MPTITRLATRRGRPKSAPLPTHDLGTPELIFKRAHSETSEAIDLCLERGLITPAQHRAGMHFRWLYTLRYGAPGVTAVDLTRINGFALAQEADPHFRQAREAEFDEAVTILQHARAYAIVMAICVYNERFDGGQLISFQTGLDALSNLRRTHKRKGAP